MGECDQTFNLIQRQCREILSNFFNRLAETVAVHDHIREDASAANDRLAGDLPGDALDQFTAGPVDISMLRPSHMTRIYENTYRGS
jgi:hypothetical protein